LIGFFLTSTRRAGLRLQQISRHPRYRGFAKKRSAESQAIAVLTIDAHNRLLNHSAIAKEYCPSSSTVARHVAQEVV